MEEYFVIAEWECNGEGMVTVITPGGCSVISKDMWMVLYGSLHSELWKNVKNDIENKSKIA